MILITATLFGFLFPIAKSSLQAAHKARCASNLSQIGKAAFVYAADNRGWILRNGSAGKDGSAHRPWLLMVAPALSEKSFGEMASAATGLQLLKCPSHPLQETPAHYVVNSFVQSNSSSVSAPTEVAGPTLIAKVRNASNVVFVSELVDQHASWDQSDPKFLEFRTLWMASLDVWHREMLPAVPNVNHLDRIASNRHSGNRVNCLYFDGSVRDVAAMQLMAKDFDDGIVSRAHRLIIPPGG